MYTKALLTDLYQLTMMRGNILKASTSSSACLTAIIEVILLKEVYGRRRVEHLIDYVENIHFSDDDLAYLKGTGFSARNSWTI